MSVRMDVKNIGLFSSRSSTSEGGGGGSQRLPSIFDVRRPKLRARIEGLVIDFFNPLPPGALDSLLSDGSAMIKCENLNICLVRNTRMDTWYCEGVRLPFKPCAVAVHGWLAYQEIRGKTLGFLDEPYSSSQILPTYPFPRFFFSLLLLTKQHFLCLVCWLD